ncbi:orexin/Hypocretin receptor type 1-like isoform X1 [Diorhabda sublineata]|uniref:orexin/Hypocretin receptor type 1-like isoform X1 n=1 Tax=Diorhabda sublineata TaxID=1163346 RepID=UPI0024E12816|nr:orexin/Hypocretin receptor type 1-like isoform X1 [Diorhabda sublineata]
MKPKFYPFIVLFLLFCRISLSHLDLINLNITNTVAVDYIVSNNVESVTKNESSDINSVDREDYTNKSTNITFEAYLEYIQPRVWTWVLVAFHSIVFVVGLIGNCLVCVAVYRNHSMRTVTNYFIVNLALADFMVILFCLPPSVIWDVTSTWWFGTALCKIVLYMQSLSVTVSVLTLTFISIDRWYAICHPLKFKSTTGRAKTAIGIIWIIAMACELPEPLYLTAVPYHETYLYLTQCEPTWSTETDLVFFLIKMIFFYFIPLVFMSVAYLHIIRVLWKSGKLPYQQRVAEFTGTRFNNSTGQLNTFAMNMNTSTEGQIRSRKKAAKMLVAVVAMFAICFFPVYLLSILRMTVQLSNSDPNKAFSLISHWLCYANSAINPIIYNFMSGKFRKEFRRAFDTCFRKNDGGRFFQQSGGTLYNKDSGLVSRTYSKNDCELRKLNTIKDGDDAKLVRKNTKSSILQMDI